MKEVGNKNGVNDITVDIESGSTETKVRELIDQNGVIIFSKTTCPFCFEMKRTLFSYGINVAVFEVDRSGNAASIQEELFKIAKIKTVPILFIDGAVVGDCVGVKALEHSGKLAPRIAKHIGKVIPAEKRANFNGLLWFPEVANNRVVRLTALFTLAYAILCCIFSKHAATKWAVLALAIDFVIRFIYGATYSVISTLSAALFAGVEPQWTCGAPKHFAVACGVFFTVFAAGLFLGDQRVGGVIVLALLCGACFLEAFLNFCLGCWMFGLAIRFGIVDANVYRPYLNVLSDRKYAYMYVNGPYDFKEAVNTHYVLPGHKETPVDLIRKVRQDFEYKLRDFDLVKHCRIEFFIFPMAVAALAFCFKLTDGRQTLIGQTAVKYRTQYAYKVLTLVSLVLFFTLMYLYIMRCFLYTKKVVKEWNHPVYGNTFSAITICIVLYGLLYLPVDNLGGNALIWLGATLQMLITVLKISDLMYSRINIEFVNPALMITPVGNYIAAIAFPQYSELYGGANSTVNYIQLPRIWFGVASLFAIVLFTITLSKCFHDHQADVRMHPMLMIWLATASVAGPAYAAVSGNSSAGVDVVYQSLYGIALFFFAVISAGYLKNFYSYEKDITIWIAPFCFAAFALNTIQYTIFIEESSQKSLFNILSIITLVIASTSSAVCLGNTLIWIVDKSLFLPRNKWGPMSFFKLTHEAFRFYLKKVPLLLNVLDGTHINAIDLFLTEFDSFVSAFNEHSKHEDEFIFPMVRRYFPQLNLTMDEEHHKLHESLDKMTDAVKAYRNSEFKDSVSAIALLEVLKSVFPSFSEDVLKHLDNEENTATCVARKYFPIEVQIEANKKSFEFTSPDEWRKAIPFVIRNLPIGPWKVRYIKTFIWATPYRAQEIGLILYHGVDSVTWLSISAEIPEIVPRGLPSHKRIY